MCQQELELAMETLDMRASLECQEDLGSQALKVGVDEWIN